MDKPEIKQVYLALMILILFLLIPGVILAQNLSTRPMADNGVLISSGARNPTGMINSKPDSYRQSTNNNIRINMEPSMVDIQALGVSYVQTVNGKTGLVSNQSYGQGIILDSTGIIATNKHVVDSAQHIYVYLSNRQKFEAKLIRSTDMDLSFIKIDCPYPLRAMSVASSPEVKIGQEVTAYTNAGLNEQRKQSGQVINVFYVPTLQMEMLEMQIPLNPGDSGGAVVDKQGSLVGLIMANLRSDHSKSFAIALGTIQQEYLKSKGSSIIN